MANEIQRLLPRHYEIIALALGGNGAKDIAQVVDMTPQAISGILNSPLVQAELARRREVVEKDQNDLLSATPSRAKDLLERSAYKAAKTHVDLLDHSDARVAQKSATEILNRVIGTNDKNSPVVVLEAGAIQILQLALQESKEGRKKLELKESSAA